MILKESIVTYKIGGELSELFIDKLMKTHDWSFSETIKTIEEYKRFIYLATITSRPVTPSKKVDDVWHLHLTFSRDYWDEFCNKVIGKQIHHNPSESNNHQIMIKQYEYTLNLYKQEFNEEATTDIWPIFKKNKKRPSLFRRFNNGYSLSALLILLWTGFVYAEESANMATPNDWFSWQYIIGGIVVIYVLKFILFDNSKHSRKKRKGRDKSNNSSNCSSCSSCSSCGGGGD